MIATTTRTDGQGNIIQVIVDTGWGSITINPEWASVYSRTGAILVEVAAQSHQLVVMPKPVPVPENTTQTVKGR